MYNRPLIITLQCYYMHGLTYMQCIHIENHYSPLTAGDKTKTQSISRGLTKKSTSYNIYFYEETIFLAFSSIFSLLNDVNSSERNRNIFLNIVIRLHLFFSVQPTDYRSWPDSSEFWTGPLHLQSRRSSALYSPWWTFSIATCSYTSNLSHANWTVSTSDAIKLVAVFRLTVGAWRLMRCRSQLCATKEIEKKILVHSVGLFHEWV